MLWLRVVFASVLGLPFTLRSRAGESVQWGVNGNPFISEVYWHVPLEEQIVLVAQTGANWYRVSIGAEGFRANTSRFDELVATAERAKVRILPVLIPPAGFWNDASIEDVVRDAKQFAEQIATRYKGRITHWELGNELDGYALIRKGERTRSGKEWIWDGAPDGSSPDDYEETRYRRSRDFIRALQAGVRKSDPSAQTMVDTAGWLHYGFIERLKEDGVADFDILSWHWYSEMGEITSATDRKIDVLNLLKERYDKPIWITEVNRRDGSKHGREKEHAEYIRESLSKLAKHPAIRAVFVYELLDQPSVENGETDYGLVKIMRKGEKWTVDSGKPALEAFTGIIK